MALKGKVSIKLFTINTYLIFMILKKLHFFRYFYIFCDLRSIRRNEIYCAMLFKNRMCVCACVEGGGNHPQTLTEV